MNATLKMTLSFDTTADEVRKFLDRVPDDAKISVTGYKSYNAIEQDPATITASWKED